MLGETMRNLTILGALVALAVPAIALADDSTPSPNDPAAQCRAERAAMGAANFKATYGTNANKSNAFGKCVSRQAHAQDNSGEAAAKTCKAEQSDPNFAASHDGKTFAQFYGTNRNGHNAYGKCVSRHGDETTAEHQDTRLNAARKCRAEQRPDPAAFKAKYGTNRTKSNAFGKCVSKEARA
jgi:hypothetical protein